MFNAINANTAKLLLQFADENGNGQVGVGELDRTAEFLYQQALSSKDVSRARRFFNFSDALYDLADGLYYKTLDGDDNNDGRLSITGSNSEFSKIVARNNTKTFSYGDLFQSSLFGSLFEG